MKKIIRLGPTTSCNEIALVAWPVPFVVYQNLEVALAPFPCPWCKEVAAYKNQKN
jgi:hypothetical protein